MSEKEYENTLHSLQDYTVDGELEQLRYEIILLQKVVASLLAESKNDPVQFVEDCRYK